jgi:hypothetical protein
MMDEQLFSEFRKGFIEPLLNFCEVPAPEPTFVSGLERQLLERQVVLLRSEQPGRTHLGQLWKQFSGTMVWRRRQYSVVILFAALVVLTVFLLTRPQPVDAKQILDRVWSVASDLQTNGIRSFEMISETTTMADVPNGIAGTAGQRGEIRSQLNTWFQETNHWRYEIRFLELPDREPNPRPSVTVADGKVVWSYDSEQNFLQIYDGVFGGAGKGGGPGLYGMMNGGVEAVLESASQCYDPSLVGEGEIIAGRKTYKIFLGPSKCPSVSAAAFNGPQTLWIDQKTFFILRREIRDLRNEHVIYTMTVTSIHYNLEIDPGIFTFTPPEGATIFDDRANAAETPTPPAVITSALPPPGNVTGGATIQDTPFPPQPTPGNVISGGTVKDGLFVFDLRLFRDPSFSQQPVATSLYSDLNGIGAYMYWFYQGSDVIGPVETYWGTLPSLNQLQSETYPSISLGSRGGRTGGILLPGGFFLSGETKAGDRIQVALKIHTPNGDFGAVLVFTLKQGANGFEPTDISIDILPPGG